MTAHSMPPGAGARSADGPLDALRELGLAVLVGWAGGAATGLVMNVALGRGVPIPPPLVVGLSFGLPLLTAVGWLFRGLARRRRWRRRRPWTSNGMAIGMLLLLPAMYAGLVAVATLP